MIDRLFQRVGNTLGISILDTNVFLFREAGRLFPRWIGFLKMVVMVA